MFIFFYKWEKCLLSKQFNSSPLAAFYIFEHNLKVIKVSFNTRHRVLTLQLKSCWSLWHAIINVSIIKNYKLFGDYFDNLLSSSPCKEKEKKIFERSKFQGLHKNIQFCKENLPFFQKQRCLKVIQNRHDLLSHIKIKDYNFLKLCY